MTERPAAEPSLDRARNWLVERLSSRDARPVTWRRAARLVTLCAVVFAVALGVRLLHRQDNYVRFEREDALMTGLLKSYDREADRIIREGRLLFPREAVEDDDARMIIHPPGYSILIAALGRDGVSGTSHARLALFQIICDSVAAVMVFLITLELLPLAIATIAAFLVAMSPHLAYYSVWPSPDSLAVLPVLGAVYLIARASRRPRLITVLASGFFLGLSCWLRSNALLLAPFMAAVIFLSFPRGKRMTYIAAMMLVAVAVIAPVTIRNWVVYQRFIPLSIGSGITLVEGIADYDPQGRFAMPRDDKAVVIKDAEWHDRPDYAGNLWKPDGIERDRARFARGLEVVRSNPWWFLGVMARRASFMLRYNDSEQSGWPFSTSQVPVISAEPSFGHEIIVDDGTPVVWSVSPEELLATGSALSPDAKVMLESEGRQLIIIGDGSNFGDQFVTAPIQVDKNTDYLLRLTTGQAQGRLAARITTPDRRIALASEIISGPLKSEKKNRDAGDKPEADARPSAPTEPGPAALIDLAFASGDRSEVRLVIGNDGAPPSPPSIQILSAQLSSLGPTPFLWTAQMRKAFRAVQKNLFTTPRMLALILAGIALLAFARRVDALAVLLAVPIYYLSAQSFLHTEYRYILAIHYFLFALAAVSIYCACAAVMDGIDRFKRTRKKPVNHV